MRNRRPLAVLLAVIALAATVLVESQPAGAAVFTVTRRDDPDPDGFERDDGSLREAIIRANNHDGPDRIVLKSGRYVLRIPGDGETLSQEGDLDIRERVTIEGKGPNKTIVDGNGLERVFEIRPAAAGVVLKGMTITGGEVDSSGVPPTPDGGGGILNLGQVRLQNVAVTDNGSPNCCGGGIYNNGRMTIVNSRVNRNSTLDCCGGGILNYDGRLNIRNSRIDHNRATGSAGGGIYNADGGRVIIEGSKLDHNHAPDCCGGAISNDGINAFIRVSRSRITNNSADRCCGGAVYQVNTARAVFVRTRFDNNTVDACCGGAIYSTGNVHHLTLRKSHLDSNTSRNCCGGAVFLTGGGTLITRSIFQKNTAHTDCCGGAIFVAGTDLEIEDSVVRANRATGDFGGQGGGIYLSGTASGEITDTTIAGNFSSTTGGGIEFAAPSQLSLLNSTISGNSSFGDGAGIHVAGDPPLTLRHVTIADNSVRGGVGGVWVGAGATNVSNTIIANNSADDCDAVLDASGRNLDRDSTCFDGPGALHGNPRLGSLRDNGGPTPTRALRPNSPAVDAATGGSCPPPPRDQRGVKRPQNGDGQGGARCDLGAYERRP
jgi:hypothetical protein